MARVFMDPRSAALVAKYRQRGPSVLERLRADEEAAAEKDAAASARSAKRRKTVEVASDVASTTTGGMSMKTGMVLARAELAESASAIVVAQDRQAALVGKGTYRDAEKVAREGSIGMLATKKMPKRKASSALQFKTAFRTWMRESLVAKVCLLSACLA